MPADAQPTDTYRPSSTVRWGLPGASLLVLAGYFSAWIDHPAAGLVITGLDLGEYVKFLPAYRSGDIALWRQGFYLPLLAVSLTLSLFAFRRELGYPWPVRVGILSGAAIAALNMLPPAWTPASMVSEEFRLQAMAIAACLAAILVSPFLALFPRRVAGLAVIALALPALWFPVHDFLSIVPAIADLYNQPQKPAWGLYAMSAGLFALLTIGVLYLMGGRRTADRAPGDGHAQS